MPSPQHANQPVTWPSINAGGGVFTPPAQGARVESFSTEVTVGQSTNNTLTWNNLRPGTYLLESATHPSIQAAMGLVGMVVVTQPATNSVAGTAYPAKGTNGYLGSNRNAVPYDAEIPLIFSEIDPAQNQSVTKAVNSVGFNEDATYGLLLGGGVASVSVTNGGSGYPDNATVTIMGGGGSGAQATASVSNGQITGITISTPGTGYTSAPTVTVSGGSGASFEVALNLEANGLSQCQGPNGPLPSPSACYPPVVNYTPLYYLINGVAFSKANPGASVFPSLPATGVSGNLLVRFVNAGSRMHVPAIVGSKAPNGAVGFQLIAEDGNVVPGVGNGTDTNHLNGSRVQSEVFMAAGKTYDVMIQAPTTGTALGVFDRELSLSGNSINRDSGMLAYIGANGLGAPVSPVAVTANPDTYNSLVAGQPFAVSDSSKGVLANDLNVYGVTLLKQATNGTVALAANGTFTYTPNATGTSDSFTYCANGTVTGNVCSTGITATVSLGPLSLTNAPGITLPGGTFTSNLSTYIKVPPPGLLAGAVDSNGLPLTVVVSSITAGGVVADATGGFTATGSYTTPLSFTYQAQDSAGTLSSPATAIVNFAQPSNLAVTVKDPVSGETISDYRWIIEEDKSFYIDPGCTSNPPPVTSTVTGLPCVQVKQPGTTAPTVPILGVNFHTSDMTFVAQGCKGSISCESGQSIQGNPVICDVGNGACRRDTSGNGKTSIDPGTVSLDPTKRYYISVLPGDAANPFIAGNTTGDCNSNAPGATDCGHGMGGAPITFAAGSTTPNPVTVLVEKSPYPPSKLAINVFEDDFPLNGEQDSGGGVDILATNEPSLGGFNVVLWDDMGGSGDVTGQMTYDMFNQPLGNSLDGTIDPATGNNACPITQQGQGITGMITVCPTYESDGVTLSPLAGQAVVANLMPGRFSVQAIPGADRIARGEEWLQTNTLDGQKAHDSFLRIGEPAYFQEFGPANYHVSIGFANPSIINSRLAAVCKGTDPNLSITGACNNTLIGHITDERMSRTPDERLYSSGSYDAFAWTQCYISVGDPDGEDFAFTKCDQNGNFQLKGLPAGSWRVTVFDEWNDMIVDGLSTPVGLGGPSNSASMGYVCTGPKTVSPNVCDMGEIATNQWQSNVYTKTFIDPNETGVASSDTPGVALVNTTVRYRDGSLANNLGTDFNGVANFNETFPLFAWYAVETDTTRYKNTGTHTVYDSGGPADGSASCGKPGYPACGTSTAYNYLANTNEPAPLPSDLFVPGSIYCSSADCSTEASKGGIDSFGKNVVNPSCTNTNGVTTCTSPVSTGRIDNPWMGQVEGWQGFSGQGNFIEFGKAPYVPGENGGIHGHVIYASTRPFDDPQMLVQTQWEPLVPHVTINLYEEGVAGDGVTPTLTLIDTTQTSSWDDWAQGFHSGPNGESVPNMNCPGQSTGDLFYFSLLNQPQYLDLYNKEHAAFGTLNTSAAPTQLPYNSQFKCYDGMHNWNQLQPAVYDGMYSFPSITGYDANGKPNHTNCKDCTTDPATDMYHGVPMLKPGKYVVEVVPPDGYEIVKEEDKNILIGDNFIAPVTQQFGGLSNIFILPDQASVAAGGANNNYPSSSVGSVGYNPNNPQNPTQSLGMTPGNGEVPGFLPEPTWPCVGELRQVPDYISLFPQSQQAAPFAGAWRNLCDRKEVTLGDQMGAIAKFYIYTSTHKASKFTGIITDDFTSEFDPFSPQFGEKFSPPNMPISLQDWTGQEIGRVYSDWWGDFDGLVYSTWEVNPPNPTGYSPNMMIFCMNDKAPASSATTGVTNPGTDPLYNPAYSQFCYELPYMPGQTDYLDTPVVPTSAFSAGYNHPDCNYPDATPAISEVDGDGMGPWVGGAARSGALASINLTSGGAGYGTAPNVKISGGSGHGATATAFISGTVDSIHLSNSGAGYTSVPVVNLVGGSGSGATAAATVSGYIGSINLTSGGSGYTSAPMVTIGAPGGTGTTATATAVISGSIVGVNVINGGSGYNSAPSITFNGPGSGASATANMSRSVSSVTMTSRGSGYTGVPAVGFNGGGGTGATGTASLGARSVTMTYGGTGYISSFFNPNRATVTFSAPPAGGTRATGTPIVSGGVITGVAIITAGSGYTGVATVTFGGTHTSTSPATGTVSMEVAGVAITAGGSGYTSAPSVSFSGGGGSGAAGNANTTESVASVTISSGGSGYTSGTTVSFSSPGFLGTRAQGTVSVTGTVVAINLTNQGSGYTSNPPVTISGGGGSGASANANALFKVSGLTLTAGGSGYSSAPLVQFVATDGNGGGATGTDTISGPVSSIVLDNPGTGYISGNLPTVQITGGGGTGAAASVTAANLSAGKLTITALGSQPVNNYGYSGPQVNSAPYNQKTVNRNYVFGSTPTDFSKFQNPPAGYTYSCSSSSQTALCPYVTIGSVPMAAVTWGNTVITGSVPSNVPACAVQQQAQYGGSMAECGQLVITAANGKQSIDAITVTVGGKEPTYVSPAAPLSPAGTGSLQHAIDNAQPGDLIMMKPGTYYEMVLMWKPVRLQGVGASSTIIDANTQPAGKMDPWRRMVNCLFGLALDGSPTGENGHQYDSTGSFTCGGWTGFVGTTDAPQVDRLPLEGIVGWDTTTNGNLAQLLQEPTLMGAYEGAGITVLGKGVSVPSAGASTYYGSGSEATFPTGTTNLMYQGSCVDPRSNREIVPNPNPSNFWCNPSRIDGITVTDASMGGGGIFAHAWTHNLEISNDRVYSNIGTLSGGINVGQGEFPDAYLNDTNLDTDPGSCETNSLDSATGFPYNPSDPVNTQEPYCFQNNVNVHNNYVTSNTSIGDELFSGTPAGAGGVTFCTGSDYYKFNYNWICGNMSTGDGGGFAHLGFIKNGDIEHNSFLFNQSLNPTIPTHGGGVIIMGAAPDGNQVINGQSIECGSVTDNDCVPGLSDGTGPGLVINANLIQGNAAEAGSGGGIRLQSVNGTEIARFPNGTVKPASGGRAPGVPAYNYWYSVAITNNIITNNVAGWDGGGISLQDALVANIYNNTIASNDTTATAGPLTDTIGAPLASAPTPGSTTTSATTSAPQAAGLVTMNNSAQLTSSFTTGPVVCPPNHGGNGFTNASGRNSCTATSIPYMANDLFWQNRSFYVSVGSLSSKYQQNLLTLYNANGKTISNQPATDGSTASGSGLTITGGTGACVPNSDYWDIGARGDSGPGDHSSGVTLSPAYTMMTSSSEFGTGTHDATTGAIGLVSQYCNGSRTPPEIASAAGALSSWNVPPGISDATVPNPIFNLAPAATVDEGNNWINMTWGPLSLVSPVDNETLLGNYSPAANSPVIDQIPTTSTTYALAPIKDFFGNPRPDIHGSSIDFGAVEYQGTPQAVLSVSPGSLTFPTQFDGTTSTTQTLTASNTGSLAAGAISWTISAPFAQQGGTCGTSLTGLNPNSSCTILIVFSPTTQTGTVNGTVTFTSTPAVTGSPVSLTGTAAAAGPAATLTPATYNYGTVNRGIGAGFIPCVFGGGPCETFTLKNTGSVTLTGIGNPTIPLDPSNYFIINGGTTCGTVGTFIHTTTLAPNATCTITVQFRPPSTDGANSAQSGSVSITAGAAGAQTSTLAGIAH